MAWRGSLSRSFISTVRASTARSSPPLSRIRPPPIAGSRAHSHSSSFTDPRSFYYTGFLNVFLLWMFFRTLGRLAAAQLLIPLLSKTAGPQLKVDVRAFCELSHGT
ncbi:unnamed protein product [Cuscuta epithymum]|uniref:Uncharacterized protein n=1 Tax=Cuscuta epithymum TaxID=186058 RepID=A0AAV0EN95_9ASTE|nr:unnamed protein product [Cuscuta epithymum]